MSYKSATVVDDNTTIKLHTGTIFSTGNIKWLVSPVPKHQLFLSKAFSSIRKGSFSDFVKNLLEIDMWNNNTLSELCDDSVSNKAIDLNTEEDFSFVLCADVPDSDTYDSTSRKKQLFQYTETNQYNHFSLLHVAVDYNCLEIVECLLERKVNVSCFQNWMYRKKVFK